MASVTMQKISPGAISSRYTAELSRLGKAGFVSQLLEKRSGLFGRKGKAFEEQILTRLGWTDICRSMVSHIPQIENLVQHVRESEFEHLFVMGMGGSSLCPEVFGKVFGKQSWLKSFTVVDTTAPSQLEKVFGSVDLTKSFFIVASKSGTTIETLSQFRYIFRIIKDQRPLKAGQYFAAVTDEHSELHRMARRNRFQDVFINPDDIGGRYSALSLFGLVPGAFTKMPVGKVLAEADRFLSQMEQSPADNEALTLGTLMGCAAASGRDKLRFVASAKSAPFIPWVEQLVAESTGKGGKGIIPIEGDPSGYRADYNNDGLFVYYSMGDKPPAAPATGDAAGKIPQVRINLAGPVSLGSEILKWETATAVASAVIGVNPFDEPNVTESKQNTAALLKGPRGPRRVVAAEPIASYNEMDIMSASGFGGSGKGKPESGEALLQSFLRNVNKGDYVSLLCYVEMSPAIEGKLVEIREVMGKKFQVVTLRGYGPRYLHSIGQLYKGGPQKGHFIVFEREYPVDFEIPKLRISFERLINAQAKGDIQAFTKRKRPVLTINLKQNPVTGLSRFLKLISA